MAGAVAIGTIGIGGVAFAAGGGSGAPTPQIAVQAAQASGGVTGASITGLADEGAIYIKGQTHTAPTTLFNLKTKSGVTFQTYCIDFEDPAAWDVSRHKALDTYSEHNWSASTLATKEANLNNIQWILVHSFPNVSTSSIASAAGISGGLTPVEAVEGTQAAIWSYSDNEFLNTTAEAKHDPKVVALYNYLTGSANTGAPQPAPTLTIQPTSVTATLTPSSSRLVGPFTVATSASSVTLSVSGASGVTLTDASGNPETTATNGSKIYLDIPKGMDTGSATINASAMATLGTGRVFLADPVNPPKQYQKLILAGSKPTTVAASASASWSTSTPSPTPSPSTSSTTPAPVTTTPGVALAHTGADNTPLIVGIVVALLIIGGGLLTFAKLRGRHAGSGGTTSGS
jgi:TQXA domain-containing protein